jgi:hypothetical protein
LAMAARIGSFAIRSTDAIGINECFTANQKMWGRAFNFSAAYWRQISTIRGGYPPL